MEKLTHHVLNFLKAEDGPTAVEYAIMLALIVVVCLAAIQQVGHNANHVFEDIAVDLDAVRSGGVN